MIKHDLLDPITTADLMAPPPEERNRNMRFKLICCEIYFREICHLVAASVNTIDLEFTPKGLHDLGSEKMVARLQACVDAVPARRPTTARPAGPSAPTVQAPAT